MKKKIINGIMMVALVAATSTSFVSCKDTNEDVRVEMQQEYSTLLGKLNSLEDKYGNLDGRVGTLETKVKNMAEDIETLQKEVDALELWLVEAFSKLVYGVEISGTYNNMLGSINIPGFEPKMLINNWGVTEKKGSFPSSDLYKGEKLEWGANKELGTTEDNVGFAGYIYANVNRYLDSTPMLSKAQGGDLFDITIANTAGEDVEGLIVGNVDEEGGPTTDVLSWGWTRADNNIYKFGVGYQGEKAKDFEPAKIDLSKFSADLKAIWRDRNKYSGTSKESLGHLLADLYYNLATKDYNMKKYGLKFKWTDGTTLTESNEDYTTDAKDANGDVIKYDASKEEAKGLDHIVTSEAELVFATIKPLGFNSGEVLSDKFFSATGKIYATVEQSEILIQKIFDKIKKQLPDMSPGQIKTIVTGGNLYNGNGTTAPEWWLDTNNNGVWNLGTDADLTNIIKPLNTDLETVKDMFANIQKLEDKALNVGTYTQYAYKFINRMRTLVDNNADQALQPTLLVQDKDGNVNRVSGLKASPYIADGEVTLYPTSYTAELLAPAYAKFVAVKDVDEQPEGFGEIIYTNDKKLKFKPESGKTYEIVYEAVDFFGNTFEHSYFIQGK